jgi:Holliday junction DNA helicase RuvA
MFNHFTGKIAELAPTHVVVDVNGVGYLLHISLNTFSQLKDKTDVQVLAHLIVREDAMILYGFYEDIERQLFKHLISVSGVGPNTARMILSSLQANDIVDAIVQKNVNLLQSVKGIGAKSAQRIIVELQDKLSKEHILSDISYSFHNTNKQEALSALVVLGFSKLQVDKVLDKIISQEADLSAEELIRKALKIL